MFVSLIGAGPGDPELISLKAIKALKKAEVLIYDYLANEELMEYAPKDAQRIFVGKKGFCEHVTQEEINTLLVAKAKEDGGKRVCRLKGGDPFVFGRGGEEALALVEEQIPFEIIPGISSGIAAPAYAGIPVTHRGMASSVCFVTGHEDPQKNQSSIKWEHLAQAADTLCFYMGIRNAKLIATKLMEHGRAADESVALIRWGTTTKQEFLLTTLQDLADDIEKHKFEAPAIIVVGKVALLSKQLSWFDPQGCGQDQVLHNKRFVITRSRLQASKLADELKARGALVFEFPTIKIVEPQDRQPLLNAALLSAQGNYDWVVLTSVNGVQAYFEALFEQGFDTRSLSTTRFAAIGSATAQEMISYGLVPDLIPDEYRAEAVLEALVDHGVGKGSKLLLPRAKEARELLPEALVKLGVDLELVEAYETVLDEDAPIAELKALLAGGQIEGLCFSSSSTVKNFCTLMGADYIEELIKNNALPKCFSIGPITSETMSDCGLKLAAQASDYTIMGLCEALENYYRT